MRLDYSTYEYIKGEAVHVLKTYDIRCIPISGFEIAHKIGLILIPYSSLSKEKLAAVRKLSQDGAHMEVNDVTAYIYYDDKKSYKRVNMTILHEIGHHCLDHDEDTEPEIAEAEAGFFAKYIVAPPPLVHQIHPQKPEDIMEKFCISYEAACYALSYYRKWLKYGKRGYTDYERKLLVQFAIAN